MDESSKSALAGNLSRYVKATTGHDNSAFFNAAGFSALVEITSTFYAMELYWALRRTDSTVTVLLEPHLVRYTGSGKMISVPLIDPLPHADVVGHLWAWTNTGAEFIEGPLTYSVNTSPRRSPANCGLLISTVDTEPLASDVPAQTCLANDSGGALISHFLLDGNDRKASFVGTRAQDSLPLAMSSTLMLPAMLDGNAGAVSAARSDYIKSSHPKTPSDAEQAAVNPFLEYYAALTIASLGVVNETTGAATLLSPYVREFDIDLAARLAASEPLSATDRHNLRLIQRIRVQELDVRARRDEAVAREIFTGHFGKSYRQARDDAFAAYSSRMTKMWLTTLSSLAMGSAMLQASGSGAAVLAANNATFDIFNMQMEAAGSQYIARMAPSVERLDQISLDLVDQSVTVPANSQAALRRALKTLYEKHSQRN